MDNILGDKMRGTALFIIYFCGIIVTYSNMLRELLPTYILALTVIVIFYSVIYPALIPKGERVLNISRMGFFIFDNFMLANLILITGGINSSFFFGFGCETFLINLIWRQPAWKITLVPVILYAAILKLESAGIINPIILWDAVSNKIMAFPWTTLIKMIIITYVFAYLGFLSGSKYHSAERT